MQSGMQTKNTPSILSRLAGFTFITVCIALVLSPAWASQSPECNAGENVAPIPISPYDFPFGYPFPEYSVAGASHPSVARDYMRKEPSRSELKRFAQYSLRLIQTDRAEEAIDFASRYLEKHSEVMGPELLFARTMAEGQLGDLKAAALSMEAAIEAGLPPQRFLAGPRRMFAPLHAHEVFVHLRERHASDLVHGPALGAMTDSSVQIWVRTVSEVPVRVTVSQSPDMADPLISRPVLSRSGDDYTAVVPVVGLDPDTRYHYTVTVGDQVIRGEHQTFHTYPTEDQAARFTIAFGGCAGFVPPRETIWDTIDRFDPRAFLQLGDNVYIDDPESPDQQRLMYYQRQSRPEYRRLVACTPTYAIWDDHDFGMDDSEGGPLVDVPYWKPMVLDIFKQNWVNPAYGDGDRPGVWFDFKIADVHFILLDGRSYREDAGRWTGSERIEGASMLGAHQLAWLLRRGCPKPC